MWHNDIFIWYNDIVGEKMLINLEDKIIVNVVFKKNYFFENVERISVIKYLDLNVNSQR